MGTVKEMWCLELNSWTQKADSKVSAYNARDQGAIPGLGISSREGNGTLLQYSCLENPTDGGVW